MEKILLALILVAAAFAQTTQPVKVEMTAVSPDKAQEINFKKVLEPGKKMEGCIILSGFEKILSGNLTKTGFNFLDPLVWDDFMVQKKSEFYINMGDLEFFTNGTDIGQVLSFTIEPVEYTGKDSILLYVKCQVMKLLKKHGKESWETDNDYNIKLFYKVRKVPYNKYVTLDVFDNNFNDVNITVKVSKDVIPAIAKVNPDVVKEIEKSCKESDFNKDISFSCEFAKSDTIYTGSFPFLALRTDFIYRNVFRGDEGYKKLIANGSELNFDKKIYYLNYNVPFELYKKTDQSRYSSYKTRDSIFRSNYEVFIIPIGMSNDSLTVDVIVDYKKLNIINDDVPRWTPFKKRIKTCVKEPYISLSFPKENWTANFIRQNEKYQIFGYSEYEKFVKEVLLLEYKIIN